MQHELERKPEMPSGVGGTASAGTSGKLDTSDTQTSLRPRQDLNSDLARHEI